MTGYTLVTVPDVAEVADIDRRNARHKVRQTGPMETKVNKSPSVGDNIPTNHCKS